MAKPRRTFNPKTFVSTIGVGRKMMSFTKGQTIYSQGDEADALFSYLRKNHLAILFFYFFFILISLGIGIMEKTAEE